MNSSAQEQSHVKQFATFWLNGFYFGIDVLKVQEVMLHQSMTKVPLAPTVIEGLINLRGQIVTAIDLRRRLEMADRDPSKPPLHVVVRSEDGATSFLVDEIGDVVETKEADYEPPPNTLTGAAGQLIRGVYKMDGKLLHILDTEGAVQTA